MSDTNEQPPQPPPKPKNTLDPLNIGGARERSEWANVADVANEFGGPVSFLGVVGAKIASVFHKKGRKR
jgi:hypothetical protein